MIVIVCVGFLELDHESGVEVLPMDGKTLADESFTNFFKVPDVLPFFDSEAHDGQILFVDEMQAVIDVLEGSPPGFVVLLNSH